MIFLFFLYMVGVVVCCYFAAGWILFGRPDKKTNWTLLAYIIIVTVLIGIIGFFDLVHS